MYRDFSFLVQDDENFLKLKEFRKRKLKVVPLLSQSGELLKLYDFTHTKSILPIDAVIMAGGVGSRLRPLTNNTPKPLLKVGGKEIISYNFDRLSQYGITNQFITVNYLAEQIKNFCHQYNNEINFTIVKEKEFFGTAGALSLIDVEQFKNEVILLMNSDLLTNIDYEDLYKSFLEENADIMVASIPYKVNLPYAIFDEEERKVRAFKEKPNYTYYANAGIYLIKKELLTLIPKNKIFNATDLMEVIISSGKNLIHYPIRQYWLDIGKHEDFDKAQKDIAHINW
jgi:NDP-sugar pyrophosphorylase family protein